MHSANLLSYALNQSKFYRTNGQDADILLEDDVQHSQVILLFLKKTKKRVILPVSTVLMGILAFYPYSSKYLVICYCFQTI